MKKLSMTFLLALAFLLSVQFVFSQELNYQDLDKYIRESAEKYEMPGLAVGIIQDDEVVFLEGYGFANTATKKKVDKGTVFAIASCSKAFTAACLAILVDEGKLSWEDRVVDLYPAFQLHDPYITREMRIKDLLCHRAGYQTFDGDLLWYGTNYTREEVMSRIRFREHKYSFRERFGYSNVMYVAAGEVIREVTGKTWDEYVQEKIFVPLGMVNTSTSNKDFTESMNIAWPHLDGKPMEFIDYDNCGPAASISTSAEELLLWTQLMLKKGAWKDTTIFSEKEYYNLVRPQTITNAGRANTINGTHFSSYALGWSMKDYNGRKIIDHGGGLPGFHSKVVFIPEENLGYVILANEISLLIPALEKDLLDFHLNDSLGWADRYFPYKNMQRERDAKKWEELEEERTQNTRPSLPLESYTGIYEEEMYGKAEVKVEEEQLYLVMLPTAELLQGRMSHWHFDTFKIKVKDPFLPEGFVTFQLEESGAVEGFKINIDNPDFHFYKLDFKKKD